MGLEKHNKASEAMCHKGYCEICERETIFRIDGEWLREHYLCTRISPVTPMPEVRRAKFLVVFFCL